MWSKFFYLGETVKRACLDKSSAATFSPSSFKKFDHSTCPPYHIPYHFSNYGSFSLPISWNRSCSEIQQSFHISHSVSCPSFKFHHWFLPPSLNFFSSCFCFNFLLVLLFLSSFDLGVLFLSTQVPHGFIVWFLLLSVHMPKLSFLFCNCTFSAFPASFLTIPSVNSRFQPYYSCNISCSFRITCLCPGYSFYSDGPFLLWLPGNRA